ncbi:MAG: matrixin family metalloprotease [Methanosarcinales archaeon]|nr:matrixin family metalloprotease [Methanosarcinales archaeon]
MRIKNKKAISTIIAVTVAVSILVAFSATASAGTINVDCDATGCVGSGQTEPYSVVCGTDTVTIVPTKTSANNQNQELTLPENAVEVAPGVFYLGESMDNGKVVEGYAFVHYVKPAANSNPVDWDETVDIYKFMFGGIKWAETMQYEVNIAGSGLKKAEVLKALGASLDTWNDAIAEKLSSFKLFDKLVPLKEDATPGENDEHNIVVWEDLSEIYGANVIAVNSFWFNPALKVIVDSDVVFNAYYTWSTDEFCDEEAMDLQNIATHEFGHNGLNDLYSSPSVALTMYGYGDFGDIEKRTLGTGDISGIQKLYGSP